MTTIELAPDASDRLWTPERRNFELARKVHTWRKAPTPETEKAVAEQLANVSRTAIPTASGQSEHLRAARAIDAKVGNCAAHIETTLGFAGVHGLNMFGAWDGSGASSIWVGALDVWCIDAFARRSERFTEDYQYSKPPSVGVFALVGFVQTFGLVAQVHLNDLVDQREKGVPSITSKLYPDISHADSDENLILAENFLLLPPQHTLALLEARS